MSVHVCECEHNGRTEYHLRYPGMTQAEAQNWADKINGGSPYDAPTPAQERCSTCGYLTSEREHLGCLRRAVKDLDIATGGPYDAQEAATDPNGWCQYVAGMVFCWLQMQKELPPEDQGVAAIAGIIERRLWAYKPAQEVGLTDGEIVAVMRDGNNCNYNDEGEHIDFARAIIAALRAKGQA